MTYRRRHFNSWSSLVPRRRYVQLDLSDGQTFLECWHLGMGCIITVGLILSTTASVTRWLDHLFNIWPVTSVIIGPFALKNCQSRFKILPNTKLTLQNWPGYLNYCQSGKISPNLVTMVSIDRFHPSAFASVPPEKHLLIFLQFYFVRPSKEVCSL